MPYIIDAHEDLAYNVLTFGRDYLRSAAQTRRLEQGHITVQRNGHSLLGWPEYQRGQVAAVFGTIFTAPQRYASGAWETQLFKDTQDAREIMQAQVNVYRRLTDDHPDQFRLILSQKDLHEVLSAWEQAPASLAPERKNPEEPAGSSQAAVTHPVGILMLMEGLEGIGRVEEMEEWFEMGARIAGPVWSGSRFCGGTMEGGGFSREGYALLDVMADVGFTLDISHMTEESALQALDRYEGPVVASHANVRSLLKGIEGERQLTDLTIRRLIERDGVMGTIPYNKFLKVNWAVGGDRQAVTLRTLAAHIDAICQIAGDALHVGIGSDFDGGFGWPAVPFEIDTIADLQKLGAVLAEFGYNEKQVALIFGGNWRRHLERTLPSS